MRALKRWKTDSDNESLTLSLSSMNKTAWGLMSNACGHLHIEAIELSLEDQTSSSSFPSFSWTDVPEGSQCDRYLCGEPDFCIDYILTI